MLSFLFLVSHRDYIDDSFMMQPPSATLTLLIISLIVCVVIPYIRDKIRQDEEERLKMLRKFAGPIDNKRSIPKDTKVKRMINIYANHCVVYKRPTQSGQYNYDLLSVINGKYVIIKDSRYSSDIIKDIVANNPERVFVATSFFIKSGCLYYDKDLIDYHDISIFDKIITLPYIPKQLKFNDSLLEYLPHLVELDLLSIKVERDVEVNTSIIIDYLSSLGLEKGKKICKLLPEIHSKRKANTATTMFENLN